MGYKFSTCFLAVVVLLTAFFNATVCAADLNSDDEQEVETTTKSKSKSKSSKKKKSSKKSAKRSKSHRSTQKDTDGDNDSKTSRRGGKKKFDPFDSPYFVKTPDQLKADFTKIRRMKITPSGEVTGAPESAQALIRQTNWSKAAVEMKVLMMYRAIVGVPFEDLKLDRQQAAHAQAGAYLLKVLGHLEHTPAKPDGMQQDLFDFAYVGTSSSNIHASMGVEGRGMTGSVRSFMNDSDPSNIRRVGHRRWCLNPIMTSTGFGDSDNFSTMWAFDQQREGFDFDYIAFPACGITPSAVMESTWAWNISFNPMKYKLTGDKNDVKVQISPARFDKKKGEFTVANQTIPLNHLGVSDDRIGVPLCVIFRPTEINIAPGMCYCVSIEGISKLDGTPAVIQYYVYFWGNI